MLCYMPLATCMHDLACSSATIGLAPFARQPACHSLPVVTLTVTHLCASRFTSGMRGMCVCTSKMMSHSVPASCHVLACGRLLCIWARLGMPSITSSQTSHAPCTIRRHSRCGSCMLQELCCVSANLLSMPAYALLSRLKALGQDSNNAHTVPNLTAAQAPASMDGWLPRDGAQG